MSIAIEGLDSLIEYLNKMTDKAAGSEAERKALEAGAKPVYDEMKARAPVGPSPVAYKGALKGAIQIGPIKLGRSGQRITVGVHRKDWLYGDEYYPAYVEFGHGGPRPAPPHPYVRPSFDAASEEAFTKMRDTLAAELGKIK